jgi:hypothetical protein
MTSSPPLRPSLGRGLLILRQKYGHGLRTAYYRDRVRPRILSTRPVECGSDNTCEIHVLTSSADWLNLVWALKSFYLYSKRKYALCIHDDGSLGSHEASTLREHFPGARLISRAEADPKLEQALAAYPRCLQFRRSNHLSPKLFDFARYLTAPRMLLLDSDILFFAEPAELLRRVEDTAYNLNSVNPDISSAYTVEPESVKRALGLEMPQRFNSGLGLIHRESLRFDWIEEFLALPGILGYFWRIEQTIFALCSARFGVELLPQDYAVRLKGNSSGLPCRHYVGAIRHLMYNEGIRQLLKQQFLELA